MRPQVMNVTRDVRSSQEKDSIRINFPQSVETEASFYHYYAIDLANNYDEMIRYQLLKIMWFIVSFFNF